MSLAAGTISTYKISKAIGDVIAGSVSYNKISFEDDVVEDNQIVVASQPYTFKDAVGTTANEVLISGNGDPAATAPNLVHAINLTGTPGTHYGSDTAINASVTAADNSDVVIFESKTKGATFQISSSDPAKFLLSFTETSGKSRGHHAVSSIIALLGDSGEYGPMKIEQDATFPVLSYSLITGISYEDKDGPSGFVNYRYQFDCLAKTHDATHILLAAVKKTFDRFSGEFVDFTNGYLLDISQTLLVRGSEQEHPYNQDLGVFHASIEFNFYVKESNLN